MPKDNDNFNTIQSLFYELNKDTGIVKSPDFIVGKHSHQRREIDISIIRVLPGSKKALTIIEYKKNLVDIDTINYVDALRYDVDAFDAIIISEKGFSEGSKYLASTKGHLYLVTTQDLLHKNYINYYNFIDESFKSIKKDWFTELPVEEPPKNGLKKYSEQLEKLKTGDKDASDYHKLIFKILSIVLENQLKNPRIEKGLDDGRKRVDIVFDNKAENGFFKSLFSRFNILSPYIFVECKNYCEKLGNPEFDQLSGRFSAHRGVFGIIVCRTIDNYDQTLAQCIDRMSNKKEFIIVLSDNDIKDLIKYKLANDEEKINELFETKLEELLFGIRARRK